MSDRLATLLADLTAVVGADHVIVDPALTRSNTTDWTARWHGDTPAVIRPGTTDEARRVLSMCAAAGVPVVPQGGNTSLVGASVPRSGELVISTGRLREIKVDVADASVLVGAGVVLERLQAELAPTGLAFGVDLAARGSATIGGMAATDAGGLNVVAFGSMAHNVLGIEAVLADGRVIDRLSGIRKDTAGYDLTRLLLGSEGTLALITRLRLRLLPAPTYRAAAMLALRSLDDAVALAATLPDRLPDIRALELVLDAGMELVCDQAGLARPFPIRFPCYVIVEVGGRSPVLDELAAALEGRPEIVDDLMALDAEDVDGLLAYRERQAEAIARVGVAHKYDVAMPLGDVPMFLADLDRRVSAFDGVQSVTFGHIAEGNLHVNLLVPPTADPELELALDEIVLGRVLELGGTVSAEHGIGIAKVDWLERMRGPDDVATMRAIKDAFDPNGILNPGVLFPLTT